MGYNSIKQFEKYYLIIILFLFGFFASHYVDTLWEQQEDAYITYTYAHQIATGHGFSYSLGAPPTYGSTTPLYTLLLALICWFGIPPHIASPWITSMCHGLIAVFLFLIGKEIKNIVIGLIAGFLWCIQLAVFFRTGGMETALYMLLIILLIWKTIKPRHWIEEPILLGLALLTRPDTVLLAMFIFGFWLIQPAERKFVLKRFAITCIVYLPWAIYAYFTFSSIIPSSIRAKMINLGYQWTKLNLTNFFTYFMPERHHTLFLVLIVLSIIGAISLWNRIPGLRPFILWIPGYYLAMRMGHAPNFSWYYVPPIFIAILFIPFGVYSATKYMPKNYQQITLVLIILVILIFDVKVNWKAIQGIRIAKYTIHHQLADRVRILSQPNDLIASFEVGNLGYWSHRPVLDLLGLVSPEIHPLISKGDYSGIIEIYKPQFVLSCGISDILSRNYIAIESYPYWAGPYTIWKRKN